MSSAQDIPHNMLTSYSSVRFCALQRSASACTWVVNDWYGLLVLHVLAWLTNYRFGASMSVSPPSDVKLTTVQVLLGSLHNYRLMFARYDGLTEHVLISGSSAAALEVKRLSYLGHGMAGLCAGLTSAFIATPIEHLKGRSLCRHDRCPINLMGSFLSKAATSDATQSCRPGIQGDI
jgi:hypothetical protein